MVDFVLNDNSGAQTFNGANDVNDSVTGAATAFRANKNINGGNGTGIDTVNVTGTTELVNLNAPGALTGWEILNGRAGVNDVFQISGTRVAQFTTINGVTGSDELRLTGGGNISLNGKTLSSVESITTDTTNTTLTVTNQAMGLLVSNMGGANDRLVINAWTGGNYVVADLFDMVAGHGIETVAWAQNNFDFTAVLNSGTGLLDVTVTDSGGQRVFANIVNSFELDGDLRKQVRTDDDGAVATTDYDANGVITSLFIDATGDGRSYNTLSQTYTDGKLASSTLDAAETTTVKTYDTSGATSVLETSVRTDKAGGIEYAWDTITETYDALGNLTQRLTVNDAGQAIVSTEVNFAVGAMTDRTITYADGRIQETLFSGGVVELTRTIATNGTQTVAGGAGDNTISGGSGNDLLIGGLGNDVFVFNSAFGDDRISDFGRGQDLLDLTAYNIGNLADITGNGFTVEQVGRNTVIDLGPEGGTITLTNFLIGNLGNDDFVVLT